LDKRKRLNLTQARLSIHLFLSAVRRMKRCNRQTLSLPICDHPCSGAFRKLLLEAVRRVLTVVLFPSLLLGSGLGTARAQDQTHAYVTNVSGTVSVIDTATNTVVATVPVGIFPSGVAITPNGRRVYVTNIFNSISVIDTATNTVVVTISSGQFPTGIAITPDGTRAYVVDQFADNQGNNTVSVIDTMTNSIVATIPVGRGPSEIAITPDGTRAYVPDQQDLIISVIDTATNTVVATIPARGTAGIAITPSGSQAYVTSPARAPSRSSTPLPIPWLRPFHWGQIRILLVWRSRQTGLAPT